MWLVPPSGKNVGRHVRAGYNYSPRANPTRADGVGAPASVPGLTYRAGRGFGPGTGGDRTASRDGIHVIRTYGVLRSSDNDLRRWGPSAPRFSPLPAGTQPDEITQPHPGLKPLPLSNFRSLETGSSSSSRNRQHSYGVMDPLSITATVVALAQAAAAIAKAISRLRAFGEVPARVYALKNEVTDLEVVLRQVGFALEDQPPVEADIDPGWLKPILSRTQIHLANLAEALERVARAVEGGKIKVISRTAIWWKEKDLFQRIQGEIHQIKATLTVLLSTSNSWVPVSLLCFKPPSFAWLAVSHRKLTIS